MSERRLTEAKVLAKMDWPCRRMIDVKMKRSGFPSPRWRETVIGDQWLEADIDRWMGVGEAAQADGEAALIRRIKASVGAQGRAVPDGAEGR